MNNIFFVIDENYVKQMLVTLNSIFKNNNGNDFSIYVVHSDLSETSQQDISNFIHKHNSNVTLFKIPSSFIDTDIMLGSRWSSVVYYKLYAIFKLPLDKVLYLDSDIIVDGDISNLFDIDMEGKYIFGVEDVGMDQVLWDETIHFRRIGLPEGAKYINAGVMLLNLKEIKRSETLDNMMEIYREKSSRLLFNEQDLINMLWWDKIAILDSKYNRIATDFRYRREIMFCQDDIIYHYTVNKPWIDIYRNNKEVYLWQVNKYLKYSNIPECYELHNKVKTINDSVVLKMRSFVKSICCINQGLPLKKNSLFEYIIHKL